jgi:two-component system OmpR family response regulator
MVAESRRASPPGVPAGVVVQATVRMARKRLAKSTVSRLKHELKQRSSIRRSATTSVWRRWTGRTRAGRGRNTRERSGATVTDHLLLDNAPNILIVDDDPGVRTELDAYISDNGYRVFRAANGVEMDRVLDENDIHVVLLDIMMPGEDGLSICRRLSANPKLNVILLSAKGTDVDRIIGLELGADDYLPKPFNPRELLAHIRALLRRRGVGADDPDKPRDHCFLGWRVRRARHQLFAPDGVLIPLSVGEFQLLMTFLDNPRRVLSRASLREALALDDKPYSSRVVDTLVCRLRKKLGQSEGGEDMILTLRSEGYMFNAAVTRQ